MALDECGQIFDCSAEGLSCSVGEVCLGGIDEPTQCILDQPDCELCSHVVSCQKQGELTRLTGRVVGPGASESNPDTQMGIPHAFVYILRSTDLSTLPPIASGLSADDARCAVDRTGSFNGVLSGTVTDAQGYFNLAGNVPVNIPFVLVVQAGTFRKAQSYEVLAERACGSTDLGLLRLPRNMQDGEAVHMPHIAISTGRADALECILYRFGISVEEFSVGSANSAGPRIHLYRGGAEQTPSGAHLGAAATPHESELYGDLARLSNYDLVLAGCEGAAWDADLSQRDAQGPNLRTYVNRGGRFFASHLSYSWLQENGNQAFSSTAPLATGLGPAATWTPIPNLLDDGLGRVSDGPHATALSEWLEGEGIPEEFPLIQPRSHAASLGVFSEELVSCDNCEAAQSQVFAFDTPYGAPEGCGRVAYSGFHVTAPSRDAFDDVLFPEHCSETGLTDQEKILLYALLDLEASSLQSSGHPPEPPTTCATFGASCGLTPDGWGGILDCGACPEPQVCIQRQCTAP